MPPHSVRRKSARLQAKRIALHDVIERGSQAAMVVVLNSHEAEGLQHAVIQLPRRAQDFGHGVHRSGLRLKGNLYEIALSQRMGDPQQASGYGDGLQFSFGASAVFETDRSQDGIS
jgi:hypothetical protein